MVGVVSMPLYGSQSGHAGQWLWLGEYIPLVWLVAFVHSHHDKRTT
ncbi:MAG TPA: hypothetical protein VF043_07750 [Ktedonobacteraceae bacterium]